MILSRFAILPEHLTSRHQMALIACASDHSLHLKPFAFSVIFNVFLRLLAFFKIIFSVNPDLGPQRLHLLSAVAKLITRLKHIFR